MISLSHLNKYIILVIFFIISNLNFSFGEDEPIDIWKNTKEKKENSNQTSNTQDIRIKSPILSESESEEIITIDETKIEISNESVIGIFDPSENNFNLDMWSQSDGEDIIKILKRINKLNLSKTSEDLLFQVLFTNSYPPKVNLSPEEFLKIKIDWLIEKKRIKDLETLLKNNPGVGGTSKAINFLIDEYLSSADIKSACDNVKFIDRKIENTYLNKFTIYCLINSDQKNEAQLFLELLKEKGFNDVFFEDKINYLSEITDTTTQKILDDNLLNFYFSHITNVNFKYEPNSKTNKYIWRYLSAANLIQVNGVDDNEEKILIYEQAAVEGSFENDEIFKIYLKINFNFNQLINSKDIYKNLPNYKARALIYQSILLADDVEKKINHAFLLKDLFMKDKLFNIYADELSNILKSIDENEIPESYIELVKQNFNKDLNLKIKFNNDILHRSKVIRHFLEDNEKINRTEKDFKSVYKKIKRNKKYFISIKDIVVLESLVADGVSLPSDIDYKELSAQLTIPNNLEDLVRKNQIGLVMLKIVEIIGEDEISDLDPETVYFLNKILNDLNLKKIRNNILSEALPARV